MDIVTSIPVRIHSGESIPSFLDEVHARIARRAFQNFVDRGSIDGRHIEDWLEAEHELILKAAPKVFLSGEDLTVELDLPKLDPPNLAVRLAPRQLVISSDVDDEGFQVCQVIDLPAEISMDGVDAEQIDGLVRVTAALV